MMKKLSPRVIAALTTIAALVASGLASKSAW
jgi:hypothetical protein